MEGLRGVNTVWKLMVRCALGTRNIVFSESLLAIVSSVGVFGFTRKRQGLLNGNTMRIRSEDLFIPVLVLCGLVAGGAGAIIVAYVMAWKHLIGRLF